MIFQVNLELLGKENILPKSHSYELSSWIYKRMAQGDESYTMFLHNIGYQGVKNKKFKLFCFSKIFCDKFNDQKDRVEIVGNRALFKVGFVADKSAESYIMGLFQTQEGSIGDRYSKIDFRVAQVEALKPEVAEPKPVFFKTLSPVLVVEEQHLPNGKTRKNYLSPEDANFELLLWQNLKHKYETAQKVKDLPEVDWINDTFRFELKSQPRKRITTIKAHTPSESKLRAYDFDFILEAPVPVLEFACAAGLGGENSQGFGFIESKMR